MHKRVKVTKTPLLLLVRAIKEETHLPLVNCKCIADTLRNGGIILLNESSITPDQWENIAKELKKICEFEYEYV